MADTTFYLIVTPGYNFPEGQPIDLAALRQAAAPTIQLVGTISTTTIADGAVTEPKLATGAVTTSKLLDGAVTEPKIAAAAVTAGKIAAGSIDDSKVNGQLTAAVLEQFNATRAGVVPASGGSSLSVLGGNGAWQPLQSSVAEKLFAARNFL